MEHLVEGTVGGTTYKVTAGAREDELKHLASEYEKAPAFSQDAYKVEASALAEESEAASMNF